MKNESLFRLDFYINFLDIDFNGKKMKEYEIVLNKTFLNAIVQMKKAICRVVWLICQPFFLMQPVPSSIV